MASEEKIFEYLNLAFRLPWQPIKFSGLDKIHMVGTGLLKEHFCKNFCQNICSEIAINANFHFSHYKSMANTSCQSNQSSYPIGTKNIILLRHTNFRSKMRYVQRYDGFNQCAS